jgi:hypothetical protein
VTCELAASSAATANSTSACVSPASSTPGCASPTLGAAASSPSAGPESPSSMTSEQSIVLRLASIFSSEASPAEGQAPPATERGWAIKRLRCGGRWPESLANFDPNSSYWRTSRISLLSPEETLGERWSGTWPRSGMCAHGTVFPLPPLAPRTSAIGSSALLPTPMARVNGGTEVSGESRTGGPMLAEVLLPTPSKSDGEKTGQRYGKGDLKLSGAVRLLPTPVANDDNKSVEAHMAMKRRMKGGPRSEITSLQVLSKKWASEAGEPTSPPSDDGKKPPAPLLNPCFVEWMLGLPEGWSDPDCPLSATEFRSRLATSSGDDYLPSNRKAA